MRTTDEPTLPAPAATPTHLAARSPAWTRCLRWSGIALFAVTASATAAVTDISGSLTAALDTAVGAGNSGRLTANAMTYWEGTTAASNVDLNNFEFTINTGGGNAQTYNGAFTGPGTLRFQGRGDATWEPDMRLGGAVANTPTGVTLDYGRVQLNKTAGVDALAGPITVNTTQTVRLQLLKSDQINDASTITSTAGSGAFHLDLGGFSETISGLEIKTGHYVNTGAGGVLKVTTLTVGGVSKPKGAYPASSGFVTGSGYIDVDNFGPPVVTLPPGVPASPTPADAADTIHPATFSKFTWAAATDATGYDFYLWIAADAKPATPTATDVPLNEYTLGGPVLSLENYKWQVVAKNAVGNTAGPEWTFSTLDRRDLSGSLTQVLDTLVGAGPARLIANATTYWQGTTAAADVNLNGFQFFINNGGGNAQTYNGAITGPGTLRLEGRYAADWYPDIRLGGTVANSPDGVTLVAGRVQLNKAAGVDALAGPITVATGGTARIQLLQSDQLNDASTIDSTASNGAFYLEMGGFSDTIGGLTLKAGHAVETGTGGVLTVVNLTVNGEVKGPGTYTSASGFVTGTGSVVVPGATTPADAGLSTVAASPGSVPADGVTPATITVTLRNSGGAAVAGKTVTLASDRGAIDTISAASGVSNASGVVTFTVTSVTTGTPVFTATDATDSVVLTETAAVTFITATNGVEISNVLTPWEPANPGAGVRIDAVVAADKSARMVGLTQTHWSSGGFSRPVELNGNTLIIDSGGGNAMNASGAISGNGLLRVNGGGIGILRIGGSVGNTYTGATEINNGPVKLEKSSGNALNGTIAVNGVMSNNFPGTGTLLWGGDNQIDDASNLTLAAGSSLNLAGYAETMGSLALTGDADVYLSGATSIARFADSSAAAWTVGKQLVIREWNGTPTGGGTEGVFFGTSASGLSVGQVASLGFMNPAGFAAGLYHAAILATGEVVPAGTAVEPVSPPYDLSPAATAARAAIYTSTGRADLTDTNSPLTTGTRIVFFGDSITWQNSYIGMLNTAISSGAGTQGKTITLVNRGINGGGVLQVRDGAPDSGYPGSTPQASFASLLASDQADIAVVFIGINDIWWRNTSAATYEQALRDLAATAAAQGVTLILATPAARDESPIGAGPNDPQIDQFSAIVQTVAADTGSTFVNLRSAFVAYWQNHNYEIRLDGSFVTLKPYGLLTYDGVHPTTLGNQMIADHLADGILAALTVGAPFDTWADTNAGGQTASEDYDKDGVPNGVEYFMGATGSTFTANPAVVTVGEVRTVTWPRDPAAVATFKVQISDNLADWTDVVPPHASIDQSNPNQVTFTLPSGAAMKFCRLVVTP